MGSNGFPTSPVPSNPAVLDVKPLRTLSPMTPHPFMSMPGYAPPGSYPFMCFNPYAPYPPGASLSHPSSQVSTQPSTPEPIPLAEAREVIDVDEISDAPLNPQPSSLKQPKTGSAASVSAPSKVPSSSKRKVNEESKTAEKAEKTSRKSALKKAEISTPSPLVGETKKGKGSANSGSNGSRRFAGTGESSKKKQKSYRDKKSRKEVLAEVPEYVTSNLTDRESVERILMIFDAVKRRVNQTNDSRARGATGGSSIRPDLRASTTMTSKALRVNSEKRIGNVPGVYIGDIFYFRIEMCLVGLHAPSMAGIDYMTAKFGEVEDPVAISIVSSGGYEGDVDDGDVLIYSGHGGSCSKEGKQEDQKLERGNLALDRSLGHSVEIRVTRGVKDSSSLNGKVYIYDGLYSIQESWIDKGKGGFSIFKYKLVRLPGQPVLGSLIWKQALAWKENPASREGVIIADLSVGMENTPVCLVNVVDDEKIPPHFFYISRVKYEKAISLMKPISGCKCQNACLSSSTGCNCTQLNSGEFPYVANGILVSRKPVIYECSPNCSCFSICRNRVSQNGVKLHFDVFKTKDKGWGLRSLDPIRSGTFICEYIGDVIPRNKLDDDSYDDEYIFDAGHTRENLLEWDGMYELLGEPRPAKNSQNFESFPFVIDAKKSGNVARFMNHSCSPNVFWQPVLYDHNDETSPHIMFFARKNIPPLMELTYDYGMSKAQTGRCRSKMCLCGSSNCRGYFG
ncbi:Histone-lysine N-methyltransferase H3 lysine-9 specific [Nymphaea thermarum]|nr:Histone-lysine N-methyltransferase H3 lysine-9 specific [Nymphaea thermarum]